VVSFGVNVAVIVEVPAPTNESVVPLIDATAVFDDEYVNDPGVDELGALIEVGLSPKIALIAVNTPRVGVVGVEMVDPVTFRPKFVPAQFPPVADQLEPPLVEVRLTNVGVGETSVVGAVALHFQPIVPGLLPVMTMK